MLRGHPMPVQVCWPALASSSSRGDARFALCRAYNARSLRNKRPTPGPGPLCPQRFSSSVTFSGDQSLLSLSLAPFDASLHGCKAVLASHCSNSSEVIPVPASIERMGLEGGSPAAPRFLLSIGLCPGHLFLAAVVLYVETETLF